MNLLLLSGFNPFNLPSWKLDRFFRGACCPPKRNWSIWDDKYALQYYKAQHGDEPFILIAHSDGGTVAHKIAATQHNCIGLACHSAVFIKPPQQRTLPVLLTSCRLDLTGMGVCTTRAYNYYQKYNQQTIQASLPRKSWHGHDFEPCLPFLVEWCKGYFKYDLSDSLLNSTVSKLSRSVSTDKV